jgi:hypothetical protein
MGVNIYLKTQNISHADDALHLPTAVEAMLMCQISATQKTIPKPNLLPFWSYNLFQFLLNIVETFKKKILKLFSPQAVT